jgi:hypothetical protein
MTERDEGLQRVLRQWEAPAPRPGLDARVWSAFRRSQGPRRRKWLPIAAGVLFAVVAAHLWMGQPRHSVRIETRVQAAGFRPIAEGKITVMEGPQKQ